MTPEPQSFVPQSPVDEAELQLQQELRVMFELDTQQQLQAYFEVAQQLNPQSWTADIQNIYRAVHTLKGGAVTVEAEAVLRAATVLEDLLSDLRYLDQAPPLDDGQLERMLQEAGELLSSTLEITGSGEDAISSVQPTVSRIVTLHEQIKQRFIPDWNELKQVHQEFAEQGFDLVILELEMAVNQLPPLGAVTDTAFLTAQQTLAQLSQIGSDLQLADDWTALVNCGQTLSQSTESALWKQAWPLYFQALKDCAKQSGHYDIGQLPTLNALEAALPNAVVEDSESPVMLEADETLKTLGTAELGTDVSIELDAEFPDGLESDLDLVDLDDSFFDDDNADLSDDMLSEALTSDFEAEINIFELEANALQEEAAIAPLMDAPLEEPDLEVEPDLEAEGLFPTITGESETGLFPVAIAGPAAQPAQPLPESTVNDTATKVRHRIKIPVPLERLDKSAQEVVETLLTTRSTLKTSKSLALQIAQLTALTQESSQSIASLRQLQDDYALLRNLSHETDPDNGTSLEQYRQGYTTINQLLENILRMSELSREIESMSHQTVEGVEQLDRNMLRLKDEIEVSRLVPFKNLTLRARAIVRDLSNRHGKPAHLVVHGEQLELDAGVIQQLEPALLHLLRNSYGHGIEASEERIQKGKSVQGTIQLTLQRRGNLYRLIIEDDGRGIDAAAMQKQAMEKGFPLTDTDTSAGLLAVICQPGFSSRSLADDISGRGVGMDVVAEQVTSLGGRFSLETHLGQGTTFTLEVPAPQLLVPCVLLQVGKRTVAIPTEEIRETVLNSSIQVYANPDTDAKCTWIVETARGTAPAFSLSTYWQQPQAELSETAVCLRVRQDLTPDAAEMWLIADDLLGQESLLINPIPSPLTVPAGFLGVSLQSDGSLTSVIDPIALTEAVQRQPLVKRQPEAPAPQEVVPSTTPTILVVDDAALMRRRLEGSLQTNGYLTHTCVDGLEALHWLQSNPMPDLVITDIEMPNMDGFTLVDRCRTEGMPMPILVVSSRLSDEWGREAKRLGANAFLNKGFATAELLEQVTQLLRQNDQGGEAELSQTMS